MKLVSGLPVTFTNLAKYPRHFTNGDNRYVSLKKKPHVDLKPVGTPKGNRPPVDGRTSHNGSLVALKRLSASLEGNLNSQNLEPSTPSNDYEFDDPDVKAETDFLTTLTPEK